MPRYYDPARMSGVGGLPLQLRLPTDALSLRAESPTGSIERVLEIERLKSARASNPRFEHRSYFSGGRLSGSPRLYECWGSRRSNHWHLDNCATDSVWIETDLVENYLAFGRKTECAHVRT